MAPFVSPVLSLLILLQPECSKGTALCSIVFVDGKRDRAAYLHFKASRRRTVY